MPRPDYALAGRGVIVTGAAQGIGAACVHRFAREGARVVIADVRDDQGQALATELASSVSPVIYHPCDVGDKVQVDALVGQVQAAGQRRDDDGHHRPQALDYAGVRVLRVRLDGNNVLEGRAILNAANHPLVEQAETMDGAASRAAELAAK